MGIIPAYAGNTQVLERTYNSCRDHPRVCGEHSEETNTTTTWTGSSPRMRGTLSHSRRRIEHHGIIPAYAGNTIPQIFPHPRLRDHPRVCGEHPVGVLMVCFRLGSSPRMRGTPPTMQEVVHAVGIIPAYAGNTPCGTVRSARCRDHPRVCGEHSLYNRIRQRMEGSSPRMRGTRFLRRIVVWAIGIIPAYAGNTIPQFHMLNIPRDHPRVCGEHVGIVHRLINPKGSSPRMRGTPFCTSSLRPASRIIPAYAGNTFRLSRAAVWRGDHPRVCGEHPALQAHARGHRGSSPRMRGTL